MENHHKEAKSAAQKTGGLLFVGCMFVGMAAGKYFNNMTIGLFGGMGLGFIMMAVVIMSDSKKR